MTKEIIQYDSPEAATAVVVCGWKSLNGTVFFGDEAGEHAARYDSCTHLPCKTCGAIISRNSYCRDCADKRELEKYEAMPRADWNGADMLCSLVADHWFCDADELADYCLDNEVTPEALRLIIGEPVFAKAIDPNEHYTDDLPEDGEVPDEIEEAFERLNRAIEACKKPLSWEPGPFAASVESTNIGENNG